MASASSFASLIRWSRRSHAFLELRRVTLEGAVQGRAPWPMGFRPLTACLCSAGISEPDQPQTRPTRRARRRARPPRAAVGLRQARRRRLRPRPRRRSASSSSPPAGRRRSCATRASRSARSTTSRASRRSWTGASRRCTRKLYAGLLAVRGNPEHVAQAAASTSVELVDLVCVNLYPFERTARAAACSDDGGHREHRHRRPDDDPRGGEEPRVHRGRRAARRATTRSSTSCATRDGTLSMPTRERLAADAFALTARYDTAIARWFAEQRRGLPAAATCAPTRRSLDLPYGENPHQRAAYYTQVGARTHVLSMVAPAPRQGAVVQQPARPRRGARRCAARLRGPGLRDRQAQQPVRRRARPRRRCEAYRGRSRATRSAPSAASSRSTARSTRDSPRRSPSSSSRCCSRPATTTTRSRS